MNFIEPLIEGIPVSPARQSMAASSDKST